MTQDLLKDALPTELPRHGKIAILGSAKGVTNIIWHKLYRKGTYLVQLPANEPAIDGTTFWLTLMRLNETMSHNSES